MHNPTRPREAARSVETSETKTRTEQIETRNRKLGGSVGLATKPPPNPLYIYMQNTTLLSYQDFFINKKKKKKNMEGGGTEAFPDLGRHCQNPDCHQLDFLPFKCDACHKVFCLEHRSYKSHDCQKPDIKSRKVIVCEVCSISIETTGCNEESEKTMLEKHIKSGDCDPKKKKKPTCPVRRCKEVLTFSNTSTCKTCNLKICHKHRFPADHACKKESMVGKEAVMTIKGRWNDSFLAALASRNGKECAKSDRSSKASTSKSIPSVKAY